MRPLRVILVAWSAAVLCGQTTIAPSTEPISPPRGSEILGLNVRQSFEVGARLLNSSGSLDKYRSDVNFGNGARLLSSRIEAFDRNGRGKLLDSLTLSTQGLGNDPYQYANLRVEKNTVYRYDMIWRQNDYFNPAANIANGQHLRNTMRRLQDHTLTLFPASRIKLIAGYSRNSQTGSGLTTVNLFDQHRGTEFPLFSDVQRRQNEYRIGAEASFLGMKLIAVRNWEFFKDDTEDFVRSPAQPADPNSATSLARLNRAQPNHGTSHGWRANIFTEAKQWFAVNGRFTAVDGQRNFVTDETALGTDRFGGAANRQLIVFGDARRPVIAANLTLSAFAGARWTVTNHTAYTHTRMEGETRFRDFDNGTQRLNFAAAQFLGIRLVTNSSDAQFQATRWLSFHGGYHFSERRIRSREDDVASEQTNRLHAGQFGIRLRGLKGFSANFDGEVGRADQPFLPVSERNYHALSSRLEYKRKNLRLAAMARSNYNFNSVSLWAHSSRSRQYGADASVTLTDWLSIDAGHSMLHLDTLTGLAYFAGFDLVESDRSLYVSNLHTSFAGLRVDFRKKADLFAGWTRAEDRGGLQIPVTVFAFARAQTFPFLYHSPMFRLSVPMHRKVRLNMGYQFYGYGEQQLSSQNYRAHTAFSSVLWTF